MGLFESLLPDTIPLTDEQFKTFLEKTVTTNQSRLLDGLNTQNAATATPLGAERLAQGNATTDWNEQIKAEEWRSAWADCVNAALAQNGHTERGNLKDASNMLMFLHQNQIMDIAGLDEKFSPMLDEQMDIRDKLKPIERRLPVLKKHMEQADIYFKHRGKKTLSEADQIRKSVYSILQQELREQQPRKVRDIEI